jgi:hypothetical protein
VDDEQRAALFVDHVRRYSELGWALVRLDGKQPVGRNWQQAQPQNPELAAGKWSQWGKRFNIGVVLGTSVPPLAVLEDDTDEGRVKLLELFGGELPRVPTVRSGGRSTHLYFLDEGYEPTSRDGIELRCGAQQVVVPPSLHPDTGCEYRWLVEPW